MRNIICIILTIFFLIGCAQIINKARVDNIIKKYSMLIAGTPRSDILKTLGNPIEKEGDYIDYYSLCLPEEATFYLPDYILTIGTIEFIATPYEIYLAMKDCPNKEDFILIYDKNNKLKQILKKYYYDRLVSIYKALLKEVDDCSKDKNLSLIYFNHENGWLYANKNKIVCNFQDKSIKIYITEIPSLKNVNQYEPILGVVNVPVLINKIITLDNANNQFKISFITLHNKNGDFLNSLPDQDWTDISSDPHIKMIADSIEFYCLNGNLKEYEQKQKIQIIDFLLDL